MPTISQLPAVVQPVSGADLLVLSQTETGGSTPGAVAVVQATVGGVLALVPNMTAGATVPLLPSGTPPTTADAVVMVQGGQAGLVPYAEALGGETLSQLGVASAASDTDLFPVSQGGNALVQQSMAAVNAYVQGKLPKYNTPSIEITNSSLTLDPSVHNGQVLIVTQPGTTIGTSVALSNPGATFQCQVITIGAGTVIWGAGVTTSSGGATMGATSCAFVIGITYSGGSFLLVDLGFPATGLAANAPNAPTSFATGALTSTTVVLSWTAPAVDSGHSVATGYGLSINGGATIPLGNASTYTATGLTASTSYTFLLTATNTAGSSSAVSASATTAAMTYAPNAPVSLAHGTVTSTSIVLNWSAPATDGTHNAATGYSLSVNGGTAAALGNVTTYTAPSLTPSTSYTFSLVATNTAGSSSASTLTQATSAASYGYTLALGILDGGSLPPNTPVSHTGAWAGGGLNFHVTTTPPAGAKGYIVYSTQNAVAPSVVGGTLAGGFNTADFGAYCSPPGTAGTWYVWAVLTDSSGNVIGAVASSAIAVT